jgi:hypothetical protein
MGQYRHQPPTVSSHWKRSPLISSPPPPIYSRDQNGLRIAPPSPPRLLSHSPSDFSENRREDGVIFLAGACRFCWCSWPIPARVSIPALSPLVSSSPLTLAGRLTPSVLSVPQVCDAQKKHRAALYLQPSSLAAPGSAQARRSRNRPRRDLPHLVHVSDDLQEHVSVPAADQQCASRRRTARRWALFPFLSSVRWIWSERLWLDAASESVSTDPSRSDPL